MAQVPDDLIIGALARRLDLVSEEGLKQAVRKRLDDPTRTLDLILGEMGLLAEEIRRALAELARSLQNTMNESLLGEASALDRGRQAGVKRDDDQVDGAGTANGGEADDTIDPYRATAHVGRGHSLLDSQARSSRRLTMPVRRPAATTQNGTTIFSTRRLASPASRKTEPPIYLSAEQRYRLIRPMARGGLGQVLLARDEIFGREVALEANIESTRCGFPNAEPVLVRGSHYRQS